MTNQSVGKYTSGFGLSLFIMLFLNAVLVIVKETSPPLLSFMKSVTGHHWMTHGVFDVVLFLILGVIFSMAQPAEKTWLDAKKISTWLIIMTIIGYVLIVGFYLISD